MRKIKLTVLHLAITSALALSASSVVLAQDQESDERYQSVMLEEVIVTARKREESANEVPLAVTAYGSQQLEALKIRDLKGLSVAMPNVAMDDIGTIRSTANFSIRGLGINSSIPSIDPTVGVFIDGVYMGQNTGIILDMFDIQSVEVLRGPQGTLFGRNVTGGAVLVNTKGPTNEFEASARIAVDGNPSGEGGLNKYYMASMSGPLGDSLGFRFSAYQNDDDGWFVNLANNEDFGKAKTTIFRPVISWDVNDNIDMTLRWERMRSEGQGPASQTHINGSGVPGFFANFERDSFEFAIDEEGFSDLENDLVTFQINWDVGFGDGTITNIFGWKDFSAVGASDIDSQPVWLFHAEFWNYQEQFSNELRYNGNFGKATVTTGVFWFTNEINYHERRNLLGIATGGVAPALTQDGGGDYTVDSLAWFASVDYQLTDNWVINTGIRYTDEDKSANIASLIRNVNSPCNVTLGTCAFDFVDDNNWGAWSGKLGATYIISDDRLLYGHITRAHRSGGYNLRNTAIDTVNLGPGPFDQETVDNIEFGYKTGLGGRGQLNAAVFYNQIDDMQREINLSDPVVGLVQVVRNTADATIFGFEVDTTYAVTDNLVLLASLGYIDPSYKSVQFDLNGDGVIDEADRGLSLPRAAQWTYSIGVNHILDFSNGSALSSRVSYAFRDRSAYTDNNLGFLLSQTILNAGLDFSTANRDWMFSLYGRNLLNSVNHGGDTQLPSVLGPVPVGGTFAPLAKGRVTGVEVTYRFR
ncbi:MAG: TonB-dependent receptor [Xanthomonadales bacterium]|nr:TonB-dependent receptor [Xanthomonadales bacterium]